MPAPIVLSILLGGLALLASSTHVAAAHVPQAVVVSTGDGTISFIEMASVRRAYHLEVGREPYGIAVSRKGRVLAVGVEGEDKVKFFAGDPPALRGELALKGLRQADIIVTPDDTHFLVAGTASDELIGIDAATMKETFRVKAGAGPRVLRSGDLRKNIYVACVKDNAIAILDPLNRKVEKCHSLDIRPRSISLSPDESTLYVAARGVDGIHQVDPQSGKVDRLIAIEPPRKGPAQDRTYVGMEAIGKTILVAANESHSCLDSVDVKTGKLIDRLTDLSRPVSLARLPGMVENGCVVISNAGDNTLQVVDVSSDGKLTSAGKAAVGKAPNRIAFWYLH